MTIPAQRVSVAGQETGSLSLRLRSVARRTPRTGFVDVGRRHDDREVDPLAADEGIGRVGDERVLVRAAVARVGDAVARVEQVEAAAALEDVGAAAAVDEVVARPAVQHVGAAGAGDRVRAAARVDAQRCPGTWLPSTVCPPSPSTRSTTSIDVYARVWICGTPGAQTVMPVPSEREA